MGVEWQGPGLCSPGGKWLPRAFQTFLSLQHLLWEIRYLLPPTELNLSSYFTGSQTSESGEPCHTPA